MNLRCMDSVIDFDNFSLTFVDNNDRGLAYVGFSRSDLDLGIFHVHSLFDITAEEIRVGIGEERTDKRDGSDEQLNK